MRNAGHAQQRLERRLEVEVIEIRQAAVRAQRGGGDILAFVMVERAQQRERAEQDGQPEPRRGITQGMLHHAPGLSPSRRRNNGNGTLAQRDGVSHAPALAS
jgi:hypothetical protein